MEDLSESQDQPKSDQQAAVEEESAKLALLSMLEDSRYEIVEGQPWGD